MRFPPRHTIAALLAVLVTSWFATSGWAQDTPSMEALIERIGEQQEGKRVDTSPVSKPSDARAKLNVHWKLWKEAHARGEEGLEHLAALRADGRSVGRTNQLAHAMAAAAMASGTTDYRVARKQFEAAESLAPQLPYPWLLHAAYVIGKHPERLPHWVKPWWAGVRAGLWWPDTSFLWALKLLSYLLLALGAGAIVFVLGQFIRNFGIVAYDFARLLPQGFSSNQAGLLLLALVVVPAMLLKSPIALLLVMLGLCTLVQRPNERLVSILVFGLLAALPTADDAISRLANQPRSIGQTLLHAQWVACEEGCREAIDALAQAHPEDATVRYTALLAAYRDGNPTDLARVIEEVDAVSWPPEIVGHAQNLKGAALVAKAEPKAALEPLTQARDRLVASAAPSFNMMRAHQMLGDESATAQSLGEAGHRDLDAVAEWLELDRRDVNSFLMVEALPLRHLWRYTFENPDPDRRLETIAPLWRTLAGDVLTFDRLPLLGLGGIALVLLGFPLRGRSSTPCPRCGQARDPSEERRTGAHVLCVPCYTTYVTGATLDYDARVHNEKVLGRRASFQRLLRRVAGLAVPGLGHHVAGHAGSGLAITAALVFSAALITNPLGLVRAPQELFGSNWSAQVTLAWIAVGVCVLTLAGVALRDLDPVGASDRSRR